MSIPKLPSPAKLIISIILNDKNLFTKIIKELEESYGEIDLASTWLDFNWTNYYEKEMGKNLIRRLISFKNLINQEDLANIKLHTNSIENKYKFNNLRPVNLDPGYLLLERFVLATGKNFAHRIYIGKNIYADLTLIYQNHKFKFLEWTYPDYQNDNILSFLNIAREIFKKSYERQTNRL